MSPAEPKGGGEYSPVCEGMGETLFGRGDKHCGTLGLYVPCGAVVITHRVGRVLIFLSSRPNWDSPTSSHVGEFVSPPLSLGGGGGTLACGRGGGVAQFQRGDTLWNSR